MNDEIKPIAPAEVLAIAMAESYRRQASARRIATWALIVTLAVATLGASFVATWNYAFDVGLRSGLRHCGDLKTGSAAARL